MAAGARMDAELIRPSLQENELPPYDAAGRDDSSVCKEPDSDAGGYPLTSDHRRPSSSHSCSVTPPKAGVHQAAGANQYQAERGGFGNGRRRR